MTNYTPFLISDLTSGKITSRDPWLLPSDGFEELDNCNLKDGVLEKRRGKSKLGQIVKIDTNTQDPTLQTNPIMGIFNYLSGDTEELVIFDKERMNCFVSSKSSGIVLLSVADLGGSPNQVRFTVATGHGLQADEIGTVFNTTNFDGTYRIEAVASTTIDVESAYIAETFGATSQISQEQFSDVSKLQLRFDATGQDYTPVVGDTVEQVVTGTNPTGEIERIIVDYGSFADTDAVGTLVIKKGTETDQFESSGQLLKSGTVSVIGETKAVLDNGNWTGDNTNFFWMANWTLSGQSKAFIVNGKDPLMVYDGTDAIQLSIDVGETGSRDGSNDINSATLIFIIKERIVLFNTVEEGTTFSQRARWCTIKDPYSWPTSSYRDIPTHDSIVSGGFLGDNLYIWCTNSVWRFAYTGDSVVPFEWQRVSASDGAIAKMSVTTAGNLQRAIGPTKLLGNNGNVVEAVDSKVSDVVLDWNPGSASYSSSIEVEEDRQIYNTYARPVTDASTDGNKYPDRVLVYNYGDDNWSTFRHDIHAMGKSSLESDTTWDLDDTWEDIDFSWNASNEVSGFPFVVIGDHDGIVYQLNTGGSDNGDAIEFNAKTARFNPYSEQGLKARLGKVEFYCDVNPDVSFDVEFYLNSDSVAYKTETITTTAVNGADLKSWHTVFSGAIGSSHSLNITNNATLNRPRIHAIRLWFRPAGKER